jgi:hypothetical protein
MAEVSLFESNLLSPEVQSLLPPGYTLRALRSNDYERGFLDVLTVLTEVGGHTKEEFTGKYIIKSRGYYQIKYANTLDLYRTVQLHEEAQS